MKYLVYILIAITLAACTEEEADLRFTTESNSNPAGIVVDYFSPDPLHCSKSYEIKANEQGGRLVLKCTNQPDIIVAESTLAGGTYTNEESAYSVSYSKNEITFVFTPLDETESKVAYSHINVIGAGDRGDLKTGITIIRFFENTTP